jgi:cytochrome c-type biogenesis protein CcmF
MPWLTGTAFLHSMIVQEKRGTLRVWNVSLVLATGILAMLGTFLVRSGILDSIHAFGASTLGTPFLAFIALLLAASIALVVSRLGELRSAPQIGSLLSRETAFLLNNLVLLGLCFVIFWGTFFPLISEALTGRKSNVGPPWFDRYVTPLALVLVLLAGIGPALSWGKFTPRRLGRAIAAPLGAALLVLVGLVAVGGIARRPLALAMFCVAAFAVASVGQELWRGTRARRGLTGEPLPVALVALVGRNRRRYGGYAVHVGVAVLLVGVAGSTAFQHVQDLRMKPGDTSALTTEKITLGAVLDVSKGGRHVATLLPSRDYYPSLDERSFGRIGRFFNGESTSELGLRAGLTRDLWTAAQPDLSAIEPMIKDADRRFPEADAQLEGFLVSTVVRSYVRDAPVADFRLMVSPLVAWIWIGGVIVVGGTMIALWPVPRRVRRRVPDPALRYPSRLAKT